MGLSGLYASQMEEHQAHNRRAESTGLVEISEVRGWGHPGRASVTEKGKPFARSEMSCPNAACSIRVHAYTAEFGEVTGRTYLAEGNVVALVEYTEIYTPTPFAEIVGGEESQGVLAKRATLRRYDDGWRVSE